MHSTHSTPLHTDSQLPVEVRRRVLIDHRCEHCPQTFVAVRIHVCDTAVLSCPRCGWEWITDVERTPILALVPEIRITDAI